MKAQRLCVERGQKVVLSINDMRDELGLFCLGFPGVSCKSLKTEAILKNKV